MDTTRARATLAGGMALTMSLALAPATMAQDTPESAVQAFMDAVAAKDFEALPGFFCEEQADQAAQFDISALAGEMPEGFDVQSLLDAFIFDIQLDTLETVSESDTEAVVHIVGSIGMDVDQEALVPFVQGILEMSGMEADEAMVQMVMASMMSEFETQSEDIDAEITLVPSEDGAWQICSDLSFAGDTMTEESSAEPSFDDGMAAEESEAPTDGE